MGAGNSLPAVIVSQGASQPAGVQFGDWYAAVWGHAGKVRGHLSLAAMVCDGEESQQPGVEHLR